MTQGVTQGVTDCRIWQSYSCIYRLHDPNGLTTECRPLTFLQRSPHLFKPSSHTSRHRVGWHANGVLWCPEWFCSLAVINNNHQYHHYLNHRVILLHSFNLYRQVRIPKPVTSKAQRTIKLSNLAMSLTCVTSKKQPR